MLTLVLGGARSGKSRYAEQRAEQWLSQTPGGALVYLATGEVYDDEMAERVKEHQSRRSDAWRTVEEPVYMPSILRKEQATGQLVLVDCLTLWLSNVLLKDKDCDAAIKNLCDVLNAAEGPIILVSNEVGLGIVPENKLARRFRDVQGIANQRVAEIADEVVFMAAGLPSILKQPTSPSGQ